MGTYFCTGSLDVLAAEASKISRCHQSTLWVLMERPVHALAPALVRAVKNRMERPQIASVYYKIGQRTFGLRSNALSLVAVARDLLDNQGKGFLSADYAPEEYMLIEHSPEEVLQPLGSKTSICRFLHNLKFGNVDKTLRLSRT